MRRWERGRNRMIKVLKNFFKRRKLKKEFSKYVSASAVQEILKGKTNSRDPSRLDQKTLGVVLVLVDYSSPSELAKNMEAIGVLAEEHGVGRDAMTNSLVVLCFGRTAHEQISDE